MALLGQSTSTDCSSAWDSRDVTRVLLSPRMGGGAQSPMNRRGLVAHIKSGESESFSLFNFFKSDPIESEELSVAGGEICDFNKLLSSKKLEGVEQCGFTSELGNFLSRNSVGLTHMFTSRKKGFRHSAFYLFALLVVTFLLVKISSVGWLGVEMQPSSAPKV